MEESHSAAWLFIKSYFIHFKFIFFTLLFFSISAGFSQKLFEKKYKTGHVYSLLRDQGNPSNRLSGSSNVVPVVFHIISNNPASITDQQIIDAVQDLNDAFAHAGPYAGSQGVNTGITFCLARIDPDGGISSGITRTQSVLTDFDQELEDSLLKKLVSWNTKQYCNIWLVDSVRNEYFTSFSCGTWNRKINKTYASFLPDGSYLDGIVATGFGPPLAGLMGSYLGLKPTFVFGSCTNNNCDTDGDGICDTPPSSVLATSCTDYENSCTSDTLSGFKVDMQDPISNFMSFTGYCTNSFTAGQAAKMRSTLAGARNSLSMLDKCNPPCSENITASFTRDNWLPVPGDQIHFTATSSGGTNYQWLVDGVAAGTNSPTLTQSFSQTGSHQVSLKVYNANPGCFAGYSDAVNISCGVLARFTPDKRIIASKANIMLDTIYFENRSVNATSYQWWISNDTSLVPQIVSTSFDLHQVFKTPGHYSIWLVASNGSCSDTTKKMHFSVNDPTIDATIGFRDVQCYQQTKIIVSFLVCNHGYVAMPAGTPLTFYDGDPKSGNANKLGDPFLNCQRPLPEIAAVTYTTILDIGKPGLNQLYAVVNDNGTTSPLVLPNNPLPETSYINNITSASNFQFRAKIDPPSATMVPGDTLQLNGSGGPGQVSNLFMDWFSRIELH